MRIKEGNAKMKNFYKVIMPGKLPHGRNGVLVPTHFGITFKDGKLSISGVVGAQSNGNCRGSAGQCLDVLRDSRLILADNWTVEQVAQFHEIWERWHLNDMRPECEHQRADGWYYKAGEEVTLYHWRLTCEASKAQKAAEKAATNALKAGKTFIPMPEQSFMASLPYSITTYTNELNENIAGYYEPKKSVYSGDCGHTEIKKLGWLRQDEHPDGLLSRPCPVCGYKYGSAWLKEEIPEDVLQWLFTLPSAAISCPWGRI